MKNKILLMLAIIGADMSAGIQKITSNKNCIEDKLKWMKNLSRLDEWSGRPTCMSAINEKFKNKQFIAQLRAHNFGVVWYEFYTFSDDTDVQNLKKLATKKLCSDIYWRYLEIDDFKSFDFDQQEVLLPVSDNNEEEIDWVFIEKEQYEN